MRHCWKFYNYRRDKLTKHGHSISCLKVLPVGAIRIDFGIQYAQPDKHTINCSYTIYLYYKKCANTSIMK